MLPRHHGVNVLVSWLGFVMATRERNIQRFCMFQLLFDLRIDSNMAIMHALLKVCQQHDLRVFSLKGNCFDIARHATDERLVSKKAVLPCRWAVKHEQWHTTRLCVKAIIPHAELESTTGFESIAKPWKYHLHDAPRQVTMAPPRDKQSSQKEQSPVVKSLPVLLVRRTHNLIDSRDWQWSIYC